MLVLCLIGLSKGEYLGHFNAILAQCLHYVTFNLYHMFPTANNSPSIDGVVYNVCEDTPIGKV